MCRWVALLGPVVVGVRIGLSAYRVPVGRPRLAAFLQSYTMPLRRARKLTKLTAETVAPIIDDVRKELGDDSPPSWVTVYRWCNRYWAAGGDVRALIPAYKKRGNRQRKFSGRDSDKAEATVKIIERVIAEKYLSKHRPTVESVYDAVCARIIETNRWRGAAEAKGFAQPRTRPRAVTEPAEMTKAERKQLLRKGVQILANRLARRLGVEPRDVHKEWIELSGPATSLATEEDLRRKRAWLIKRIKGANLDSQQTMCSERELNL